MTWNWRYRSQLLLGLIVLVPLGYSIRFAQGLLPEWFRNAWGNLTYETFWIFFLLLLVPKLLPRGAALTVFILTCLIEVLQLWQDPWLVNLRNTTIGGLILGHGFTWEDFPTYAIGSLIGWWLASLIYQGSRPRLPEE
ncbi:MAG: DUF2809 domain-containing protein [Synechococcales bacterium]|nr:DUF2809 domain-containing protein [Synechococcales bacterium]